MTLIIKITGHQLYVLWRYHKIHADSMLVLVQDLGSQDTIEAGEGWLYHDHGR